MRDDVKSLLQRINEVLEIKLSLLQKFLTSEQNKIYSLKSDDLERLSMLLEDDMTIIEEINTLDFSISEVKTSFCRISGIDFTNFDDHIRMQEAREINKFLELSSMIHDMAKAISAEREKLLARMQEKSISIKTDLDSISDIIRLKTEKEL